MSRRNANKLCYFCFHTCAHEDCGIPVVALWLVPGSLGAGSPTRAFAPSLVCAVGDSSRSPRPGDGVSGASNTEREAAVNHIGAAELSDAATVLAAAAILLMPLAIAGIAIINTGLARSRNAAHMMMASLLIAGVAAVAYVFCGFSWQGLPSGPGRLITLAGKDWNWMAR